MVGGAEQPVLGASWRRDRAARPSATARRRPARRPRSRACRTGISRRSPLGREPHQARDIASDVDDRRAGGGARWRLRARFRRRCPRRSRRPTGACDSAAGASECWPSGSDRGSPCARPCCPIGLLFEADQVDRPVRREPLEIGQHLALAERLEHAVIADVEDSAGHQSRASRSTIGASDARQSGMTKPNRSWKRRLSSIELRGRLAACRIVRTRDRHDPRRGKAEARGIRP